MSSTLARACMTATALSLVLGVPTQAQITGLKKRVRGAIEKATGASASAEAEAAQKSPYNEHVLEMTAEVVERFAAALAAEEAEREEIERIAAAVRTPEAYQTCLMGVVTGPDYEALMAASSAASEKYLANPRDAAAAEAHRAAQQALVEHMKQTCGADPDTFRSSELPKLQTRPTAAALAAGGFTDTQYAILKERVAPLCGLAEAAGDGVVRIPGDGKNIFWVYSAEEVDTLTPRCEALSGLIEATL
jgi:hypothetical protein